LTTVVTKLFARQGSLMDERTDKATRILPPSGIIISYAQWQFYFSVSTKLNVTCELAGLL